MLSIDEAIAREKYLAKIYRSEIAPKEDYHNMPWIDMENESNMRRAKEHEQLAEWLEELKMYRESSYGELYSMVYNKAIDDAKSVILQTIDNEILVDTLHLRLEQLKEKTEK